MNKNTSRINSGDVPIIFSDGTAVYDKLEKDYICHDKGLFILAPSGTGKTHFINKQLKNDWIDGDLLWIVTGADYSNDEWNSSYEEVVEINAGCDVITGQAKKQGFWVLGSSNLYLKPDAVVLPPWKTHKSYIKQRENNNYDGGAKLSDIKGLKDHIDWINNTWKDRVPFFESIDDAVKYLTDNK